MQKTTRGAESTPIID